ncbi:MAG TPA: hypothetical protein VH518_13785 [Tepidisphaeraceae bacterium]|jgi:hypothetical protein
MARHSFLSLIFLACVLAGCASPSAPSLTFPRAPLTRNDHEIWYDTNADGKPDFGLVRDESGKINLLEYDDNEDGRPDRIYRLSDYENSAVPHLVILLDSIPYQAVAERYRAGDFNFFDPPQKVIPPFPSMSEQIFSRILHAPPLPGVVDDAYDPRRNGHNSGILQRVEGYHQPWEYRCNYVATYWESVQSFLEPRKWFNIEMARARQALDTSPDRVTVVYIASSSSMLCKYARPGLDEVLDEAQRLCLQVLYERHGAVKISMCADHGHNLVKSQNIHFEQTLKAAGFNPTGKIQKPNDVVLDLDGLVTYLGIHTTEPQKVADALLTRSEIELVTYMEQDKVIVRDPRSAVGIEYRAPGRFRYFPLPWYSGGGQGWGPSSRGTAEPPPLPSPGVPGEGIEVGDPLHYRPVLEALRAAGKLDADGFASDQDWFDATVDHQFPDAPRRLWDAYHGLVVDPPTIMLTVHDGYSAGDERLRQFITMLSTHGGLNQVNSATFLMTMNGRSHHPIRSFDIIPTIEPGYELPVRPR